MASVSASHPSPTGRICAMATRQPGCSVPQLNTRLGGGRGSLARKLLSARIIVNPSHSSGACDDATDKRPSWEKRPHSLSYRIQRPAESVWLPRGLPKGGASYRRPNSRTGAERRAGSHTVIRRDCETTILFPLPTTLTLRRDSNALSLPGSPPMTICDSVTQSWPAVPLLPRARTGTTKAQDMAVSRSEHPETNHSTYPASRAWRTNRRPTTYRMSNESDWIPHTWEAVSSRGKKEVGSKMRRGGTSSP